MRRFDFRRQKIRGWKRRVRAIEAWKKRVIELDIDALANDSREYVKIWIHPFYSLRRYTLPNWYKRLIINALKDIYATWEMQMETIDEPYYLKMWLFDKEFERSQIVVAFRDCLHFYEGVFDQVQESEYFPKALWTKEIADFTWDKGNTISVWSASDLLEEVKTGFMSEGEKEQVEKSAYRIEKSGTECLFIVKEDTVWIGCKENSRQNQLCEAEK